MTDRDSLRKKALQFLEQLKDGVAVRYGDTEIEYVFDPSPEYDMVVRRINDIVIIDIYGRNVRCTIRVAVDKNGEWRLRRVTCRR
jgi:hypothetical protein